jgi:hypothetical protein
MKPAGSAQIIAQKIYLIRSRKVMLDSDLAELYGVTTKRLNEQVRRNAERFPDDFVFRLSSEETDILRSQNATSSLKHGGRRYLPFVFTEHGALMAASVLNTPRAIEVSLYVVRAFVKLREMIASHKDISRRLNDLEKKYDGQFRVVFDAIRALVAEPKPKEKKIGFLVRESRALYN